MGTFAGLSQRHNRQSMTAAVLIGASFALRDKLVACRPAGTSINRVIAVGGGSQSSTSLQVLADVLQMPVDCPANGDLGAALVAASG